MEAVVCKGGKGICTGRQEVAGRQAGIIPLTGAAGTKAWHLGDPGGAAG